MFKPWADIDSLYRVGAILSKHCTKSGIDWVKTFESAEWYFNAKSSESRVKEKHHQYGFTL
jgi:hypothetical protein